jgi:hypothetical protein
MPFARPSRTPPGKRSQDWPYDAPVARLLLAEDDHVTKATVIARPAPAGSRSLESAGAFGGDGTGIGRHFAQVPAAAEGGRLTLAQQSPPIFQLTIPHAR